MRAGNVELSEKRAGFSTSLDIAAEQPRNSAPARRRAFARSAPAITIGSTDALHLIDILSTFYRQDLEIEWDFTL